MTPNSQTEHRARQDRGRPRRGSQLPTLADLRVSRQQSSEWQQLSRAFDDDDDIKQFAEALVRPTMGSTLAEARRRLGLRALSTKNVSSWDVFMASGDER